MKVLRSLVLVALTLGSVPAVDLPRQSPEFVINYPNGERALLSKYRGKIVLAEFLFTTCPHCQHTAEMFSKLQNDYGAKGLQTLGIAFNEMSNMLVPDFIKEHKPTFPIGFASRESVQTYLSISPTERFVVPQIVLIDRRGVIRLQSPPLGDANLQEEKFLRVKIEELLSGAPAPAATKPTPTASSAPKK